MLAPPATGRGPSPRPHPHPRERRGAWGVSGLQGSRIHRTGPSCLTHGFPCQEMGKLRHGDVQHPVDPGESIPIPQAPMALRGCTEMWYWEGGADRWLFLPLCLLSLLASILAHPLLAYCPRQPVHRPSLAAQAAQCHCLHVLLPIHHSQILPKISLAGCVQQPTGTRQCPHLSWQPLGDEPSRSHAHAAHTDQSCHTGHPCSVAI